MDSSSAGSTTGSRRRTTASWRSRPSGSLSWATNTWRHETQWPPEGVEFVNFYLHSQGKANTLNGDGTLSPEAPSHELPDVFVYDPRNPVPTLGGALAGGDTGVMDRGGFDQRPVEARHDVLVYSTSPLDRDTEVTGPLAVTLFAASSAPDTDFTAKLVDVYPSGEAINLTDGIIRARYRESLTTPQLTQPGQVYLYTIDLVATSNVFRKGHQIRLEVSSSNFPRFDCNPNTGEDVASAPELRPALQTVYHNTRCPFPPAAPHASALSPERYAPERPFGQRAYLGEPHPQLTGLGWRDSLKARLALGPQASCRELQNRK